MGYFLDIVNVPLTQNEYDALVSFTFNAGQGGLERLVRESGFNGGNYNGVARVMLEVFTYASDGVQCPGLIRRREEEIAIFYNGIYS